MVNNNKKYGILLGRFQPFHLGHMNIVSEIIADGLTPVLIVGGVNKDCHRHPFSIEEIDDMIDVVYGRLVLHDHMVIMGMKDYESWDEWYGALDAALDCAFDDFEGVSKDERTFYVHRKECDEQWFEFRGREYHGHYIELLEAANETVKDTTYPVLDIDATTIRKDLEGNKHMLDGRVYNYIKQRNSDERLQ